MILEATLNLVHQREAKIYVAEIATEFNRIQEARGERIRLSPAAAGHRLKDLGFTTRRLGADGKGLIMDQLTITQVHKLAAMYGGVGLEEGDSNLHCQLCADIKELM